MYQTLHRFFFAMLQRRILLHLTIIYIHFHHFCMSEHMIFRHFFWFDCVWLSPFQDFYELHKCLLYEIWCVLFGLLGHTTKLESLLNGLRKSPKALMQLECSFGCWVVKSLSNYNSAESKYTFSFFENIEAFKISKCFLSKCRLSDQLFGIIVQ